MVVERLGIVKIILVYLDFVLKGKDFLKGINFVLGGFGYDFLIVKIVVFS